MLVFATARVQHAMQIAAQVVQVTLHLPVHFQRIFHRDLGVGAKQSLGFGHIFVVGQHGVGEDEALFGLFCKRYDIESVSCGMKRFTDEKFHIFGVEIEQKI